MCMLMCAVFSSAVLNIYYVMEEAKWLDEDGKIIIILER